MRPSTFMSREKVSEACAILTNVEHRNSSQSTNGTRIESEMPS